MLPQIEEQAADENAGAEADAIESLGPGRRGRNRRHACRRHGPADRDRLTVKITTLEEESRRAVVHLGPRSPRPQRRPGLGPAGAVGGCGAVVRRPRVPAACRGAVGRAAVGSPRADRGVRQGVRFPAPVVLRSADDRGDAVSRRVVADQAARTLERIPSAGSGSDPGAGPGTGSQDGAAQVRAFGGDGTRRSS